jgi:ribonuclease BN (tRNA processing enzyme)
VFAKPGCDGEVRRFTVFLMTGVKRTAGGYHALFCEAAFLEDDAGQAARTSHLPTRTCGEITTRAQVAWLVPFHFSRRYADDPERIYEEVAAVCCAVAIPESMAVFRSGG